MWHTHKIESSLASHDYDGNEVTLPAIRRLLPRNHSKVEHGSVYGEHKQKSPEVTQSQNLNIRLDKYLFGKSNKAKKKKLRKSKLGNRTGKFMPHKSMSQDPSGMYRSASKRCVQLQSVNPFSRKSLDDSDFRSLKVRYSFLPDSYSSNVVKIGIDNNCYFDSKDLKA